MKLQGGTRLYAALDPDVRRNERGEDSACEERALRADWIPAFSLRSPSFGRQVAGNAGFARFQCFNINGVILGLVPRILVDGFEGNRLRVPSGVSNRDSRDRPENDTVGVVGFLEMNVGLRLGQSGCLGLRVPITLSTTPVHPERCGDALHEAHAQHQHRIDPAIERRRGSYSV